MKRLIFLIILSLILTTKVYAGTLKSNITLKSENDFKVFEKVKKLNNFRIKHIFEIKKLIKKLILQNKQIFAISASPRGCVLLNSANFTRKNINFVGEVPGSFKLKKFIPGTNIPLSLIHI